MRTFLARGPILPSTVSYDGLGASDEQRTAVVTQCIAASATALLMVGQMLHGSPSTDHDEVVLVTEASTPSFFAWLFSATFGSLWFAFTSIVAPLFSPFQAWLYIGSIAGLAIGVSLSIRAMSRLLRGPGSEHLQGTGAVATAAMCIVQLIWAPLFWCLSHAFRMQWAYMWFLLDVVWSWDKLFFVTCSIGVGLVFALQLPSHGKENALFAFVCILFWPIVATLGPGFLLLGGPASGVARHIGDARGGQGAAGR